jgi:hypothetical protein
MRDESALVSDSLRAGYPVVRPGGRREPSLSRPYNHGYARKKLRAVGGGFRTVVDFVPIGTTL